MIYKESRGAKIDRALHVVLMFVIVGLVVAVACMLIAARTDPDRPCGSNAWSDAYRHGFDQGYYLQSCDCEESND